MFPTGEEHEGVLEILLLGKELLDFRKGQKYFDLYLSTSLIVVVNS